MNVLVTGGAGYIGGHMVLALRDAGLRPVVLDNLSTGFRWSVPEDVPLVVGDAGDYELVLQTLKAHSIDAIVHFAAKLVVPESVRDPLGYYLNNTVKSRSLLAAAVAAGIKIFVFSSTAAVYGNASEKPLAEDAPLAPLSPYGSSKQLTEVMLRDVAAVHDMRFVAIRYFNVAGADPTMRHGQSTANATHLIKVAVQTALGMRPSMEVYGTDYPTPDGTCIRDYIHVTDLIAAHMQALDYLRKGGESVIVNCGYGHGYSVSEVIDTVRKVSGRPIEARVAPRRAGDPATIVADSTRIRARLNWQPRYDDLATIVDHTLRWESMLRERNLTL
ncbi:UDP-glucose 4-epimerase GalE [Microvirga sp. KLBC 81]|uniref:UDP-glucose 4-epimerase GalE n=1 Tax=Microvirga sp. KLBC 81 TaxID=1862707 RepID=UPI000D519066|nr:UDP-glucose 4-epimerase GalE [Microvirga sp. KLBC 81]PVE25682.1 UDP-glucose 4-epimerase GalE [Microvirga sp. KLBC 81]